MTRLSVCAIALDEQDLIATMLFSVRDVADELKMDEILVQGSAR